VNLATHTFSERSIDQLMARERPQALEGRGHDAGAEMGVVLGVHLNPHIWDTLPDEGRKLLWIHDKRS
jgi:hypothetical protein